MEVMAMSQRGIGIPAVAAALLSLAVPLFAHHGSSVFDTSKSVTMKGSVSEWDWSNPHCLLQFDVKNDAGDKVHWIAETQNPAEMVSLGWGKTSFKPGDEVTVSLWAAKNGKPFGRVTQVALPNGKTFVTVKEGLTPKEINGSSGDTKSDSYPKQ
jgi:hypothetical protein